MAKLEAHVNPVTRRLDLSDGRSLPISSKFKSELFPESAEERIEGKKISNIRGQLPTPLHEALFQAGEGSGLLRGAKDTGNFLSSLGEAFATKKGQENLSFLEKQQQNYEASKRANERLSSEISDESPIASLIGKGAGIVGDIVATRKLPAAKALPLLSAAEQGTDIIRSPLETLQKVGVSAAEGFLADRLVGGIGKIASRRGEIRANKALALETAEKNRLGAEQNLFEKAEANKLYQQQKLDYKQALIDRKNEINRLHKEKSISDLEHKKLMQEYERELKAIPQRQKEAQELYSKEVVRNAKKIEDVMAKGDQVLAGDIAANDFIRDTVNSTELAGSREAREVERFLKATFPDDAILNAEGIVKRYEALEKLIQKSNPVKQKILLDFKDHLGKKLPQLIETAVAYRTIAPKLRQQIIKSSAKFLKDRGLNENLANLESTVTKSISQYHPREFIEKLKDGSIASELANSIIAKDKTLERIEAEIAQVAAKKNKTVLVGNKPYPKEGLLKILNDARNTHLEGTKKIVDEYQSLLKNIESNFLIDIDLAKAHVSKRLGKAFQRTGGKASEIVTPANPETLSNANVGEPASFFIQNTPLPALPLPKEVPDFIPQNPPQLSPAQGLAKVGDVLENLTVSNVLNKGKNTLTNNPITKLAALKYVLGKAAVPLELGALGGAASLKLLTQPTTAGQFIREYVVNQGSRGIFRGFHEFAKTRYKTYQNGVIQSPDERFRAAHDVEVDPQLNIEEKAILQKKINRGEPII